MPGHERLEADPILYWTMGEVPDYPFHEWRIAHSTAGVVQGRLRRFFLPLYGRPAIIINQICYGFGVVLLCKGGDL